MSASKMTDEEMLVLEAAFIELTNRCVDNGISPYACAAIMTKVAFMIYKTSLNSEEYNLMIDSISDNRNKIRSFDEYTSIGRLN